MKNISRTLPANLANAIREDIMSGGLAPGEPLRQAALAERYDVSRIPVREALLQLESQGLVRFEPHKGALVTGISAEEAAELFHMRLALEPDAVRKHVMAAEPGAFDKVGKLLDAMYSDRSGVEAERSAHWGFHKALYSGPAMPRTIEILDRLHLLSERYVRLHLMPQGRSDRADNEHRAILHKCQEGDADGAATLVSNHISSTYKDLQAALAPDGSPSE